MKSSVEDGWLLIDKPIGISSFGVIKKLQTMFRNEGFGKVKMGHSGTLDPFASGLLIVALGKKTKHLANIIGFDKEYQAQVCLGQSTDTLDTEGSIIERKAVSRSFSLSELQSVASVFLGCCDYQVPAYSAVKVSGSPLYRYIRLGKDLPELPVKNMCVYDWQIKSFRKSSSDLLIMESSVSVSSGTYIRTLAYEFGKKIGYPAMLTGLRRTKVGGLDISMATRLEAVDPSCVIMEITS